MTLVTGLGIAVAGFLFLLVLQQQMRPYALNGVYYQAWPSELFMQTVALEDLRDEPFRTLFNLHIEPPALDAIRALFAQVWYSQDLRELLTRVDRSLYVLWAVLYGLSGTLIFYWLSATTGFRFALGAAIAFLLHPAGIYYATFLDATFLTAFLVLLAYYLLWRQRNDPHRSLIGLCLTVVALFLTRPIFHVPAVIVFSVSLLLLNVPMRRVMLFLLVCGGIAGLYAVKQFHQFGMLSTSSFAGYNLTRSIGYQDNYWNYLKMSEPTPREGDSSLPNVLRRETKLLGTPNFNHIRYLDENQFLIREYREHLTGMPLGQLAATFWENFGIYFLPSSQYHDVFKTPVNWHIIVDRLSWRQAYDGLFSFPVLPALLACCGLAWAALTGGARYREGLALLLPGLYIFLATVLFEKGENMRFKFYIEPLFFVLIASQGFAIGKRFVDRLSARDTAA